MEHLEQLAAKRLGRNFLYFDSIHSTNTYLKEQGAQLPDGTAVAAGHQYAGRGRQGRSWQSSEEALALSVLLKGVPPYLMQMLPILFGIGARRALSLLCGREILLKWPNDLLLGEKKIAGILCESAGFGEDTLAVCGIGVNLLQDPSFFAELPYGSSLWAECGVRVSPAAAGGAILTAFEEVLDEFAADGFSSLREEYAVCCINLGREVRVVTPAGEQTGFACGIGEDGCLLVRTPAGEMEIRSGEASVRGLYGYV